MSYTPSLELSANTTIRRLRELPLRGNVLVKKGERVTASTPVLKADLPGELEIIRLAERLGIEPEIIARGLRIEAGKQVEKGEILFEQSALFGLFTTVVKSPASGTVEFYTAENAHLGIRLPSRPIELAAYISGAVVEVEADKAVIIESSGALLQGAFGVGGESFGEVTTVSRDVIIDQNIRTLHSGPLENKIVVGGTTVTVAGLRELAKLGVRGVITGSITSSILREYTGKEVISSVTGDEAVPFPLIITEGFGSLPIGERFWDIARSYQGKEGSMCGVTQVRAGAVRPELVIPNSEPLGQAKQAVIPSLNIGAKVRCIRVPYFGKLGRISALPKEPAIVESGAVVRLVEVELADSGGKRVTLPRANIELLAE